MGLEREFPAIILRLALLVHCGPRAFKEKSFVGPWVQTTGLSIIAGCASSVSITRCILYNILGDMRRNYRPAQINTWFDDCPQLHVGDKDFLKNHCPRNCDAFCSKTFKLRV